MEKKIKLKTVGPIGYMKKNLAKRKPFFGTQPEQKLPLFVLMRLT